MLEFFISFRVFWKFWSIFVSRKFSNLVLGCPRIILRTCTKFLSNTLESNCPRLLTASEWSIFHLTCKVPIIPAGRPNYKYFSVQSCWVWQTDEKCSPRKRKIKYELQKNAHVIIQPETDGKQIIWQDLNSNWQATKTDTKQLYFLENIYYDNASLISKKKIRQRVLSKS